MRAGRSFPSGSSRPGDKVVCFLHWTARGKGSGIETDLRDAEMWTLRDGKVVHWRTYLDSARRPAVIGPDRAEALGAAGIGDADPNGV